MRQIISFQIETAYDADVALEGARVKLKTTEMFSAQAWAELVGILEGLDPTAKMGDSLNRSGYHPVFDYSAKRFRDALYEQSIRDALYREFSRYHEVTWTKKEDADEDIAQTWMDFMDESKSMVRAMSNRAQAGQEYRNIASTYGSKIKDARDLIGLYVHVSTGRRNARGWVVRGRGDTIHMIHDPWPLSGYDVWQNPGAEERAPENFLTPHHNWDPEETIRFTRSKSNVEIILPKTASKKRRTQVAHWWNEEYIPAREKGAEMFAARADWINRGGARAKARADKIAEREREARSFDPVRNSYGDNESWAKAVLSVVGNDPVLMDRIKNAAVTEFLNRQSITPLNEQEKALLNEDPNGPTTLEEALKIALENIRNPKPVEPDVPSVNEMNEIVGDEEDE